MVSFRSSVLGACVILVACSLCALAPTAVAQTNGAATDAAKGPVSIGILVDSSFVGKGGTDSIRNAMRTFLRSLRPPDEYALFTVAENFRVAQEFTKNADLADAAVRLLKPGDGGPLWDGIISAVEYVDSEATNKRKALLVISSGEDKGGSAGLRDSLAAAQKAEVQVFAITIPGGSGQWNLQQLADRTSGATYIQQQSDLNKVTRIAARDVIGPPIPDPRPKVVVIPKPLARYAELIVRDLKVQTNDDTADFQPGDNLALQKQLVTALTDAQLFPALTDATATPDLGTLAVSPQTKLELVGTIVEFRRGNYFKRSTVGWMGSGVPRLKIDFLLRDAATGATVLTLQEYGSGSSGILRRSNGKNQDQAARRLLNNLVKDLQHNRVSAE